LRTRSEPTGSFVVDEVEQPSAESRGAGDDLRVREDAEPFEGVVGD
jgi:hypothetical protein